VIPGVIVTLLIGQVAEQAPVYLLPIAAGGFIHIAACDFLPALHQGEVPRRAAPRASVGQIASVILGVAAVTA
jgi:zinc and cadmium transporter